MDKYKDYMLGDNNSYAEERYKNMYTGIKIDFGIPSFINTKKLEEIVYTRSESIYKFNTRDANRNYPFKFYNILNVPESNLIKIINSDINNITDRLKRKIYQYNFEKENKRISVLLITSKNKLYSAYIILDNKLEPVKNIKSIIEYTDILESLDTIEEANDIINEEKIFGIKMNKINSLASIARMNGIETTNRLRDDIVSEYTDILESLDTIDESIIVKDISLLPIYKINEELLDESYIEEETEIINESYQMDYENISSYTSGVLRKMPKNIINKNKKSYSKMLNKYENDLKAYEKMNNSEKEKFCKKITRQNQKVNMGMNATSTLIAAGVSNAGGTGTVHIKIDNGVITTNNYEKITKEIINKLKYINKDIDSIMKSKGIKEGYAIDLDSLRYVVEYKKFTLEEAIQEIKNVNYIGDTYPMYCVIPENINENITLESFIVLNEALINSNITPISSEVFTENEFINEGMSIETWKEPKVRTTLEKYEKTLEEIKEKKQKFEKMSPSEQKKYCLTNTIKITTIGALIGIPTLFIGSSVYSTHKTLKGDNTSLGPNQYKKQLNNLIGAYTNDIKKLKKRLKELESKK